MSLISAIERKHFGIANYLIINGTNIDYYIKDYLEYSAANKGVNKKYVDCYEEDDVYNDVSIATYIESKMHNKN